MTSDILNSLLKEYDKKRTSAELDLIRRKDLLYELIPEFQDIDNELNKCAFSTAKNLLNDNNSEYVLELKQKIKELKLRKEHLLIENGYNIFYLTPFYECQKCKDTGYIKLSNNKTEMCSCLKQKLLDISFNKSNISNLSKENFNTFNENIFSDEVDIAKYKQNISPKRNIINIKNKCIEFVNNFDNKDYKNLLFTGNTGLGKTFMSNCIADSLLKKGKTVLYQTAPVLLENVIDYKMNKQKYLNSNFYDSILETDLLIIDDLGTENLNSMKLSELFIILNTRLLNSNNKITKTIISTNLSINDIFKFYEERIGSRIVGNYDIYYFFGDDLRFKK